MPGSLDRLEAALADRYVIEREIGAGGMATVYLARDLRHERRVAVKVLRSDVASTVGAERFLEEVRVTANLQHPNILPLFDSGEADGFLYFVMPYIEGESLRQRLVREGELPVPEAARLVRDVVDALGAAHMKGVVHRDIKPENILLSGHHAMVTDFGVAKAVSEATGRHHLTTEGVALGTPAYMSPEQAAGEWNVDQRADIYAVGVLAYELLTGKPPFSGTTAQQLLTAQVMESPRPVSEHRAAVPPSLEAVIMRCLEKKPADRWQSVEEMLPHLEAAAASTGGMTPAQLTPVGGAKRRTKTAWVGAATVALTAAIIGAWIVIPRLRSAGLDPNRVLVLAFTDESGGRGSVALGPMAQDYIIQRLSEAGFAEVVDPLTAMAVAQNVTAAEGVSGSLDLISLARDANAGTVVSGTYYVRADSVHIQTRITDANDRRLLATVGPIVGSLEAPHLVVGRLGQAVAARLAPLLNRELSAWEAAWPHPPRYEAYSAYTEGLRQYLEAESDEGFIAAGRLFEQAVDADSSFYRAMIWAAQSYSVMDYPRFAEAEALVERASEHRGDLSRFDQCRLDFATAGARRLGLAALHDAARCMAQAAPGSDDARREVALFVLRSNRPAEAIQLLEELDPDRGLMKRFREYWRFLSAANHMEANYEAELKAAREARRRDPESLYFLRLETGALVGLGRLEALKENLNTMRTLPSREMLGVALGQAALELQAHGHPDLAREVFEDAVSRFRGRLDGSERSKADLAEWLYNARHWDEASALYQELAEDHPNDRTYIAALGRLAARRGDRAEAVRVGELLTNDPVPRKAGVNTMNRARIEALLGNPEEATTLLQRAIQEGYRWGFGRWVHLEPDLESLRDFPAYQEYVRPKG